MLEDQEDKFDFETILETSGLQDETLKVAMKQMSQSDTRFHQDYLTYKALKKEYAERSDTLLEFKQDLTKQTTKLNYLNTVMTPLWDQISNLQNEIANLNSNLEKISSDIHQEISEMDEKLKDLYSKFNEQSVEILLDQVNLDLTTAQKRESILKQEYNKTVEMQSQFAIYGQPDLTKIVEPVSAVQIKKNEDSQRNIKNNIVFLTNEYNKNVKMLKNYSD